jgi:hypothetical protein
MTLERVVPPSAFNLGQTSVGSHCSPRIVSKGIELVPALRVVTEKKRRRGLHVARHVF